MTDDVLDRAEAHLRALVGPRKGQSEAVLYDEEGRAVDRSLLEPEATEPQDEEPGPEPEAATEAEAPADPDEEQAT